MSVFEPIGVGQERLGMSTHFPQDALPSLKILFGGAIAIVVHRVAEGRQVIP